MSGQSRSLTFEQTVPASPDAVYRAFTNATALREWFCDVATTIPREGGRCYFAWHDGGYSSGAFVRLVPEETVAFSWHGRNEPAASEVEINLSAENGGTAVQVAHSGLGTGPLWEEVVPALEQAWSFGLKNLSSVFDSGADLRLTERPMLGILVGDFDEDIAGELGVPVSEGIRLEGVVAEMAVGAAGLQEGDVIVEIGGRPVVDGASLRDAMQTHRAGDEVDVTSYRGPQKQEATLLLSGRPIPEIPETSAALADAVREQYRQTDEELATFFSGVDEAEATYKPAPGAWSAREVLAHLIQGERVRQHWMADLVGGHEGLYDDWGGNIQAWIEGTVASFDSTEEMLAEIRRLNEETVAFIANLPPEFMERKPTYWRLAYRLLQEPFHHHTHMEQIEAAITAARAE